MPNEHKINNFEIKFAEENHLPFLEENDKHISKEKLKRKIEREEILIMELNSIKTPVGIIGWLRYNFFWDEIPFMNMLYFLEEHRKKGYGSILVKYWENMLHNKGFNRFLTSTMATEGAQHFYRKLGYTDIGGFILPLEALEILLMKDIKD